MEYNSLNGHKDIDLDNFPRNALDEGIHTALGDIASAHPLEDIEYKNMLSLVKDKNNRLIKCFGRQEAMKLNMECNMCAKSKRLPGMKSSMLSLEILMDDLDTIQPFEYLNVMKPRNEFGIGGIHSLVSKYYGIE